MNIKVKIHRRALLLLKVVSDGNGDDANDVIVLFGVFSLLLGMF